MPYFVEIKQLMARKSSGLYNFILALNPPRASNPGFPVEIPEARDKTVLSGTKRSLGKVMFSRGEACSLFLKSISIPARFFLHQRHARFIQQDKPVAFASYHVEKNEVLVLVDVFHNGGE